jgi:hypothetical protein
MQGDEGAGKQPTGRPEDVWHFRGFDSFLISQASAVFFPGVIEEGHLTGTEKRGVDTKNHTPAASAFTTAKVYSKKFYI